MPSGCNSCRPDHVHLKLLAQLGQGHDLQGAGVSLTGVVDQAMQAIAADLLSDLGHGGCDGGLVGNVESDHSQLWGGLGPQLLSVGQVPDFREYAHSLLVEMQCGGGSDPRRGPCDENIRHLLHVPRLGDRNLARAWQRLARVRPGWVAPNPVSQRRRAAFDRL